MSAGLMYADACSEGLHRFMIHPAIGGRGAGCYWERSPDLGGSRPNWSPSGGLAEGKWLKTLILSLWLLYMPLGILRVGLMFSRFLVGEKTELVPLPQPFCILCISPPYQLTTLTSGSKLRRDWPNDVCCYIAHSECKYGVQLTIEPLLVEFFFPFSSLFWMLRSTSS